MGAHRKWTSSFCTANENFGIILETDKEKLALVALIASVVCGCAQKESDTVKRIRSTTTTEAVGPTWVRREPGITSILLLNASNATGSHRQKLAGVSLYARKRKWNVQSIEAGPEAMKAFRYYREVLNPVGAIVETRFSDFSLRPALGSLPTVFLDDDPVAAQNAGRLVVCCDQAEVSHVVFGEFQALRFASVGYAGWYERKFWSMARAKAFEADAAAAGVACSVFAPNIGRADRIAYEESLVRWIERLPAATGVFAANDEIGLHVLSVCGRLGIAVPSEVAVLGVDNDESRCVSAPCPLSSVQLDFMGAGYMAGELLDKKISGAPIPSRCVSFGPTGIFRRESSCSPTHGNPKLAAALALIRAKACEGLRASEVLSVIGGSRRLAEVRFREAFGKSVLEEIQNVRFERIRFLLANTTRPLGAIANFCGYKSPETLRRLFARREGMSMSEYRARNAAGTALRNRL